MKLILRSRILCAVLAGILSMCAMSSCASVPEPEAFNLAVESLSHEVDGQDVILSAALSSGNLRTFKCSFIYGNGPEETMSSVPAEVGQYRFSCRLTGLRESTEYFYKACVTNGRNVRYSEWSSFVTPDTDPGPGPGPDPDPDPEPDPDPDPDPAPEPEPVFDRDTIEMPHVHLNFAYPWQGAWPEAGDGWFHALGEWNGHLNCSVDENETLKSRSCHVDFNKSGGVLRLEIIQHSYLENIDFKCPAVKQQCVGLWDRNGDGELSYEEAVAVTEFAPECFDVSGITSFDELGFFVNVSHLPPYLFEGSSLENAILPYSGGYQRPGLGMFKDCHNLKNIRMNGWAVSDEMFMNCVSLRETDAIIQGKCAFMGCTGLETAVTKTTFVPEMAFKDCSSLSSFTFAEGKVEDYYVGAEAFYGCASLPEITIPRKVDRIGERAFYGCSSLKAVYLSSSLPPILGADVFTGTSPDLKIYVPSVLVDVYKSSWPALAEHIEARE